MDDRRTFLRLIGGGSTTVLAGCLGSDTGQSGDGDATTAVDDASTTTARTGGTTNGSVPARYETATGLSDRQRDPSSLSAKDTVAYQSSPKDGQGCSGCQHFIPAKGDDELGACVLVEGRIHPDGWCKLFSPTG
ncbi:high-potential iron-sulfur protein [Halococcus thailandensis]|nr:high-potential iron-sulfur protein [Halococcus thailandensis]